MCDNNARDIEVARQFDDQLVDLRAGNWVESGTGFVIEQDLGIHRHRPRDAAPAEDSFSG